MSAIINSQTKKSDVFVLVIEITLVLSIRLQVLNYFIVFKDFINSSECLLVQIAGLHFYNKKFHHFNDLISTLWRE